MDQRQIGRIVAGIGVLAILVGALADPLGIGGTASKFGWKQIALIVVGLVLVIGGVLAALGRLVLPEAEAAAEPERPAGEREREADPDLPV